MRLFYASLVLGIASFVGAVASVVEREWLLAGILFGVFAAYCLVGPRLVRRIPEEQMECPRFRGHLSAWSAMSGLAGRIVRHAKGIEFQEAVSAGVPA